MGYFKISPPWDSNEGYISECVLRVRDFEGASVIVIGSTAEVDRDYFSLGHIL